MAETNKMRVRSSAGVCAGGGSEGRPHGLEAGRPTAARMFREQRSAQNRMAAGMERRQLVG